MSSITNPVLVNALRGDVIENCHRGAIAVCDPRGQLIRAWGDTDKLVYPRSSIKALQALPLVESGAAKAFALNDAELALACSSHNAEPTHTECIGRWLERIDLDQHALECGVQAPMHEGTAKSLLSRSLEPDRIHNNCSGKHTGMLTMTRFLEEPLAGYIERDHPAQQHWFDALGEMADVSMRDLPWNRDGCGIPVIAMPLRSIATAFARFAIPDDLPSKRSDAVEQIRTAIAANPFMVAGTGRLCTEVMQLTGQRLLIKSGADGVYTAALPELGLGLALKIDDGNAEAAMVSLLACLRELRALRTDELEALAARCRIPISNTRGTITGYRQTAIECD